jgi:hypothetical protein
MRIATLLVLVSGLMSAQYPVSANAFSWTGVNQAGPFCWGFSCTPVNVTVLRGEAGSLFIRGDYQQPYLIGLSFSATRCLTIPSAYNMLVLDDPFFVVFTGTTSTEHHLQNTGMVHTEECVHQHSQEFEKNDRTC